MSNEIKVGGWTVTEAGLEQLRILHGCGMLNRKLIEQMGRECCEILGVDPNGCGIARDFAEEIVFQNTPPMEAIAKLKKHLESQ